MQIQPLVVRPIARQRSFLAFTRIVPLAVLRPAGAGLRGEDDRAVHGWAHVLVGGGGVPVHPHERQVLRLGGEDLHRYRVGTPGPHQTRDVEFVASERARDLERAPDALAIEPDVGPVVDAVEVEREGAGRERSHLALKTQPPVTFFAARSKCC